ncbi:MAG: Type 4 prepilin-like proteins leader peptide-processing enzyme [Firmicutes bacterium]|nr:Type 4 prepilin-like proteins leader peptide-processing enzyme [Bacillota bacterium]
MTIFIGVASFIFGSVVGSFLNVCIYRLPREESILTPGSRCQHCSKHIAWYDNIPFISFIMLRRRCRHCQGIISSRYFLVEFLTAGIFLSLFLKLGVSPEFFIYLPLVSGLILITFIDFDHWIIPDVVTLPGIILGIVLSTLHPEMQREILHFSAVSATRLSGFFSSVFGAFVGGFFLYLTGVIGRKIAKKEVMGGGDVKLLAMIGAFLGWQLTALTIFLSAFAGSVVGIIAKIRKGESYLPYGPYLALGAVFSVFWGKAIIEWYIRHLLRGGS